MTLRTFLSISIALALMACGGGNSNEDTLIKLDTSKADTTDSDAADSGPSDSDGGAADSNVGETDVTGECTTDDDCEDKVTLGDCEKAVCEAGTCLVAHDEYCCKTVDDCDPKVFFEAAQNACLDLVCKNKLCQAVPAGEGCCVVDGDCFELASSCCQTATCFENACVVKEIKDCCENSQDCDDDVTSTTDLCLEACVKDGCLHKAPQCDVDKIYANKSFDDGTLQALKVVDTNLLDEVTWHVTSTASVSPPYSIHMGQKSCNFYYNGPTENCVPTGNFPDQAQPMNVRLETKEIGLEPDLGSFLGFWVRMAAKEAFPGEAGSPPIDIDYLRVTVTSKNKTTEVWKSTEAFGLENTTNGQWSFQTVSLSGFTGSVKVVFEFISYAQNNYLGVTGEILEGVFLDDVTIQATCDAAYCANADLPCPDDGNGCTSNQCTLYSNSAGGVCAYPRSALGIDCQPCGQPADCGVNECHDYACTDQICSVNLKDECCSPNSVFPETTDEPETTNESFESGDLGSWTVEDPTDDNVSWQVVTESPHTGSYVLYFGDPATGTYEALDDGGNGQPAAGTVWSKNFLVPEDEFRRPTLNFWLDLSTEYDGTEGPGENESYDTLTVVVKKAISGEVISVWNSAAKLGNTTDGIYKQIGVDLTKYINQYISIGFSFDTGDAPGTSNGNAFGGVSIDDVSVDFVCGAEPCLGTSDCDDDDACTLDYCDLGTCTHDKTNPLCCTTIDDCDDQNECTLKACIDSECVVQYDENVTDSCCSEGQWVGNINTGFDKDLSGFTVESDSLPVTWSINNDESYEGGGSVHFANPATGTYNVTGKAVSGQLITPNFTVPPYSSGTSYVEFMLKMHTEWDAAPKFDGGFPYIDELSVKVKVGKTVVKDPIWTSHFTQNSTYGSWILTRAELTAYAGQEISLIFEFNSFDSNNNGYSGVYIDNLAVSTSCQNPNKIKCMNGGDCPGGGDCGLATCTDLFQCTLTPKNTPQCCEPSYLDEMTWDFEGDEAAEGWEFKTCEPGFAAADPTVEWQIFGGFAGELSAKQGLSFLYFGNGTDYGAINKKGSCGTALSPPMTLPAAENWPYWRLFYWSYVDVEKDPACNAQTAPWADKLEVKIIDTTTGEETTILAKPDIECNAYGKWIQRSVDLEPWAGSTIKLFVGFTTWDNIGNSGTGLGFDQIQIEKGCAEL